MKKNSANSNFMDKYYEYCKWSGIIFFHSKSVILSGILILKLKFEFRNVWHPSSRRCEYRWNENNEIHHQKEAKIRKHIHVSKKNHFIRAIE